MDKATSWMVMEFTGDLGATELLPEMACESLLH